MTAWKPNYQSNFFCCMFSHICRFCHFFSYFFFFYPLPVYQKQNITVSMKAVNAWKSHSIIFRKVWMPAKEFADEVLLLSKCSSSIKQSLQKDDRDETLSWEPVSAAHVPVQSHQCLSSRAGNGQALYTPSVQGWILPQENKSKWRQLVQGLHNTVQGSASLVEMLIWINLMGLSPLNVIKYYLGLDFFLGLFCITLGKVCTHLNEAAKGPVL